MLNPKDITDAVVTTLQAIPDLASAMTVTDASGNPAVRIYAYHYLFGQDFRLAEAIQKMPAPSIMAVWEGTLAGNFDGSTLFKHRVALYIRMGNAGGNLDPVGYEDLWWTICNAKPTGASQNIRYLNLLPALEIMDTPGITHLTDGEALDIFRSEFVFPEIGDN